MHLIIKKMKNFQLIRIHGHYKILCLYRKKEIKDNKIVIKFQSPLCVRQREENKDYYYSFENEKFEETLKMNIKEQLKITNIPLELVETLKVTPIKAKK